MVKFLKKDNKNFWDEYAKKLKDNPRGAHSDSNLVELENNFIETILKKIKPDSLLDIGCGNGQRTIRFSKYVKSETLGVDYSKKMIEASQLSLKNQKDVIKRKVSFKNLDANMINNLGSYDVIVSCRCLVNQTSSKKQIELFELIHHKLKKNGSLIIAEQSEEGVKNLNSFRRNFGLEKIKVPWHNLPINEKKVLRKIDKLFKIKKISRLGMFYFLTRVIHPAVVAPKDPNPNSSINNTAFETEKLLQNKYLDMNESMENIGAHLLIHFIKK